MQIMLISNDKTGHVRFLIKFVDPQYVEGENGIQNGVLHFESLWYFSQLAKSKETDGIRDPNEGSYKFLLQPQTSKFYLKNSQTDNIELISLKKPIPMKYFYSEEEQKKIGICSFFAIKQEDLVKADDTITPYALKPNVVKDLERLGWENRIPIMIPIMKDSTEKLENSKRCLCGLIKYYPYNVGIDAKKLSNLLCK